MNHYAHTKMDESGKTLPTEHWEPLFSVACPALGGAFCKRCDAMQPGHGHLNKVGWLGWLVECANCDMFMAIRGKADITVGWTDVMAMEASA